MQAATILLQVVHFVEQEAGVGADLYEKTMVCEWRQA
jgi:hypothetical protein